MSGPRFLGASLGVVLFWLGAGMGWLGAVAGTCTMGDADNLFLGVPALALYLGALGLFWASRPPRWLYVLGLLPLALPLLIQLSLALRLAFGVIVLGQSACEVLHGGPYEASGEEGFYVLLWVLLVAVPIAGLPMAYRRATR